MPLREAEARVRKIEGLFAMADAQVSMAVAEMLRQPQLSRRTQRKAMGAIHGTLDGTLHLARPQVAGLLKVAYLRAFRERLGQNFKLGKEHEAAVEDAVTLIMIRLGEAANAVHHQAMAGLRQQLLRQWDKTGQARPPMVPLPLEFRSTDGNRWSLEHYAGAVVRATMTALIESASQAEERGPEYAA